MFQKMRQPRGQSLPTHGRRQSAIKGAKIRGQHRVSLVVPHHRNQADLESVGQGRFI